MEGISGWLLVYLIGSIPVATFYAAGLSGWYYDYPMWLFFPILVVLLVPLALLALKLPCAPFWNIVGLWAGSGLITLRILTGMMFADLGALTRTPIMIMTGITATALIWSVVWTLYFLRSVRVASTFS